MLQACALVVESQSIVSRRLDPADIGVVSVTEILTNGTRNALPGLARVWGDALSFRPEVSATIEAEIQQIAAGLALLHRIKASVAYRREFMPLVKDADYAAALNEATTGCSVMADGDKPVITVSEDFVRFWRLFPAALVLSAMAKARSYCTRQTMTSTTRLCRTGPRYMSPKRA